MGTLGVRKEYIGKFHVLLSTSCMLWVMGRKPKMKTQNLSTDSNQDSHHRLRK